MSRRTCFVAVAAALVATSTPRARAQPMLAPPMDAARPRLLVALGLDPALTLTLQYLTPVHGATARSGVFVGGGIKLPTTLLSHHAWRAGVTSAAYRVGDQGLAASGQATAFVAHNRNDAGRMLGIGTELRGAGGHRGPNGFWGLELGWQETIATNIHHADATRAAFRDRYPDRAASDSLPVDGWYRAAAQRVHAGLLFERRTGSSGGAAQLGLGAAFIRQKQHQLVSFDLAQIPLYLEPGLWVTP